MNRGNLSSTLGANAVDAFYLRPVQEVNKSRVVQVAFEAILRGNASRAAAIIQDEYPFTPLSVERKGVPPGWATKIFFRDGFIDRYSGKRLVFPPVLKIISNALPTDFPYHPHWKMDDCHVAYWELYPTVDHVVPLARGGSDDETNLVCTSMLSNGAKANWKLEELGWQLFPAGDIQQWTALRLGRGSFRQERFDDRPQFVRHEWFRHGPIVPNKDL